MTTDDVETRPDENMVCLGQRRSRDCWSSWTDFALMKPVPDGPVADVDVACYPQFTPRYIAVAVLFLRDVRTTLLSRCLVVDPGHPVRLLSATLPALANRPLSLWMTEWFTTRRPATFRTATPPFSHASARPLSISLSRRLRGMVTKAPEIRRRIPLSLAKRSELCLELKQLSPAMQFSFGLNLLSQLETFKMSAFFPLLLLLFLWRAVLYSH